MNRLHSCLLNIVFVIFLSAIALFAQAPTLNPEKTVNLATGEMGFSLPLGVVKGINGHDYTIGLNYGAGIKLNNEASAVGLGFSYEPGGITKREIFINDEIHGNVQQYKAPYCDEADWVKIFNFIVASVSLVSQLAGDQVTSVISMILSLGQTVLNLSLTSWMPGIPAGGPHLPQYNWDKDKKGFFSQSVSNGGDLPDMYFVNTPYINGQMVWTGSASSGNFVMKNTMGNGRAGAATVDIKRTVDADGYSVFEIKKEDGTRLFFEKSDKMAREDISWDRQFGTNWHCCYANRTVIGESVPNTWHLTKILFNDYVDGSGGSDCDPLNSIATNKGGWICFKYDSIVQNISKPWIISQAGEERAVYEGLGRPNQTKIFYLKAIVTPNDSAEYVYSMDRKDLVYLKTDYTPFLFPVLRQIKIHNKQGLVSRTIAFTTDYTLRPHTMSANKFTPTYADDWWLNDINAFNTLPGNDSACALTLKSVSIGDVANARAYSVQFSYDPNPPAYIRGNNGGFLTDAFNMDNDCKDNTNDPPLLKTGDDYKDRYWFIEQKDLWGYYCPKPTKPNDFNQNGLKIRECAPDSNETPYAAAWSLKTVSFDNGLSISWDYECQRYNHANGVEVHSESTAPRYGGGIRVKQIACNGFNNETGKPPVTWNYFYSANPTEFSESSGGYSGYATFDPYNYLVSGSDYRISPKTRGGIYTSGLVAYQQVKVVKNYQTTEPHVPFGYSVYEFSHAGDPSAYGFHPNGGEYGEIDSSWERGLLLRQTEYNSKKKIISQLCNYYSFIPQSTCSIPYTEEIIEFSYGLNQPTIGWFELDSTASINSGIRKTKHFKYQSSSLETPLNEISQFNAGAGIQGGKNDNYSSVFCATKLFGNPDIDDYVVAVNNASDIFVSVGTDIIPNENPSAYLGKWTSWARYTLAMSGYLVGANYWNIDNTGTPDLVLVIRLVGGVSFVVVVIHDYTGGAIANDKVTVTTIDHPSNWGNGGQVFFSSCTIANFYNSSKPELTFLGSNIGERSGNTIDGSSKQRGVYCLADFTENQTPDPGQFYSPQTIYSLCGLKICFTDYEKDLALNDLVVTGPDIATPGNPIACTILKSILLDPTTKKVNFAAGTPIACPNLLKISDALSQAGRFSCSGVSYDVKSKTLTNVFFDGTPTGNASPGLRVIQYSPRTYPSDNDGQPNQIIETNSDGKQHIIQQTPAYCNYPEMLINATNAPHMLAQTCQTKVFAGPEAVGSILREYWSNITATSIDGMRQKLLGTPNNISEITDFDCPQTSPNIENFGERISGYITAPLTGNYSFWIASDDNSELWLSTDESPSNAQKIAFVNGWTNYHQWNKFATQQSWPIPLVAGKRYYIETLHLEISGGDHLSVGWEMPGGSEEAPVRGIHLTPMPTPKNAVGSQVTTWANSLETWKPSANYVWKTPMNASGAATTPLIDFAFDNPAGRDASWQFTGSVEKYDASGAPLETKNANLISNSTVYRNDFHLPIGSITNANFYESGVFTCDYDLKELYGSVTYLDKTGGWEKGCTWGTGNNEISSAPHFGQKSLHLNNGEMGIIRVFKVRGGVSYTFSAWARVNSGTLTLKAEYKTGSTTVASWPVNRATLTGASVEAGRASGTTSANWQLIKTSFTVPTDDNYYVIAYIGNSGSYDAYIDDIRFGPSNAMISSTYYDQLWQQPILSVDANGNPGKIMEYDGFGRPVNFFKIDKRRSRGYIGADSIVQHKTYHLMNETATFPDPNKWYVITSTAAAKVLDADITGAGIGNGSKAQVYGGGGQPNQQWQFQEAANGTYHIVCRAKPNYAIAANVDFGTLNGALSGSVKMSIIGSGQNFQWTVIPVTGETDVYQIVSPFTSSSNIPLVLDADNTGGVVDNGHVVQVFQNGNQTNQKWRITEP